MKGKLLDFEVEIDERAIAVGGSWEGPIVDGLHSAWGEEELRLFYRRLKRIHRPTFLDIGASTGSFCLLTKFVPGAKCVAFEPHPPSFEILQHHIQLNGLEERVLAIQFAIFNNNGKAELKVPASGKKAGMSCIGRPLRFKKWTTVEVKTRRLDDVIKKLLPQLGRAVVDLVKIDTEGAELMILQGGRQVFAKWKPSMLLEYYEPNCRQFSYQPGEIIDLLMEYGYKKFTKIGLDDLWVEAK